MHRLEILQFDYMNSSFVKGAIFPPYFVCIKELFSIHLMLEKASPKHKLKIEYAHHYMDIQAKTKEK